MYIIFVYNFYAQIPLLPLTRIHLSILVICPFSFPYYRFLDHHQTFITKPNSLCPKHITSLYVLPCLSWPPFNYLNPFVSLNFLSTQCNNNAFPQPSPQLFRTTPCSRYRLTTNKMPPSATSVPGNTKVRIYSLMLF